MEEGLIKVYSWFTKGFDTKDWQDAKAVLDDLVDDEHTRGERE